MSDDLITQAIRRQIAEERHLQDVRWGNPGHDDYLSHADWVAILARQLGLAAPESAHRDSLPGHWRRQMVRIAAVAVAALEAHYRAHGYERPADHAKVGDEGRAG